MHKTAVNVGAHAIENLLADIGQLTHTHAVNIDVRSSTFDVLAVPHTTNSAIMIRTTIAAADVNRSADAQAQALLA